MSSKKKGGNSRQNQGRLSDQQASDSTRDQVDREHPSRVDELGEERATHPEADMPWLRPSQLEAPPPRPGMTQRWVRITLRGEDDPRNASMRMREGWRPRDLQTIPDEFKGMAQQADASMGRLVVDDLMLCEMPIERYNQRKAYYDAQTAHQMEAVEHDLQKQAGANGPRFVEKQSEVSFAPVVQGRRVEAAPD